VAQRFLALDWDQQQLHVVSANIGRHGVRIERAVVWSEPQPPSVTDAAAQGKALRDHLKSAALPPRRCWLAWAVTA